MLDLETLGTKPGSVILSIGAVQFDLDTGKLGESFYQNIDIQSCLDAGLTIDPDTLYWWLKQDERAGEAVQSDKCSLEDACVKFSNWTHNKGRENLQLWGNGSSFDCVLLESAFYSVYGANFPIPFWNWRDMRTIVNLAPEHKKVRVGTAHNALDDAISQVGTLCNAWRALKK